MKNYYEIITEKLNERRTLWLCIAVYDLKICIENLNLNRYNFERRITP